MEKELEWEDVAGHAEAGLTLTETYDHYENILKHREQTVAVASF